MKRSVDAVTLPNSDAQRERLQQLRTGGPRGGPRQCVTAAVEVAGELDEAYLRAALTGLVRRRPALGSVFLDDERHLVGPCAAPGYERRDVPGATPAARWAHAHDVARAEASYPSPARDAPLLRCLLLTAEPDRHLLVIIVDQLVCDAWSAKLIVDDLLSGAVEGIPDGYVPVWRARHAWLAGAEGQAAVARRRGAAAGALLRWPIEAIPDSGEPQPTVQQVIDIDAQVAGGLRERVRRSRGSLLAAMAAALVLSAAPDAARPLALRSTLAGRDSSRAESVVGWLANDAVLVLPPPGEDTVVDYLVRVRGEVFAALQDQLVPYERVRPVLAEAPTGLSLALLFLPSALSGGAQQAGSLGSATASRAAVTVCPTGADLDLFVVEDPPPSEDGARPALRLGATGRGGRPGRVAMDRLLRDWTAMLATMSGLDWATTPVRRLTSAPAPR